MGVMGGWAVWVGWVLHEKPHAAAVNCSDSVWAFGATPAAGKAKPGKPTSWQLIRGFYMPPTHALWLGKWQTHANGHPVEPFIFHFGQETKNNKIIHTRRYPHI